MNLKKIFDKAKPQFEEGGKYHAFWSLFDGFESFLFVSNSTSKNGTNIHDAIDSKRIMSMVVIALIPALLFGMYNVGYQNYLSAKTLATASFFTIFSYGFLAVMPKVLISYIVGLGIEFAWAQWKHEEIQEGYLVTGIIIPLIIPVTTPLWMLAVAIAFAVIIAKEIFGGTGMNFLNVALVARAFLFFSYPSRMSGENVWVANNTILGFGNQLADGYTMATPLGLIGQDLPINTPLSNMIIGLMPGCIGETSIIAIGIGAIILLWTGVASWKTMLSVFLGGGLTAFFFQLTGVSTINWYEHLCLGGFAFGAVFMATDPVTSARTETGKWIYGLLIGIMAIIIRLFNPGYPEGMMLAILLMNVFAPLIDYCVVEHNVSVRIKRAKKKEVKL